MENEPKIRTAQQIVEDINGRIRKMFPTSVAEQHIIDLNDLKTGKGLNPFLGTSITPELIINGVDLCLKSIELDTRMDTPTWQEELPEIQRSIEELKEALKKEFSE